MKSSHYRKETISRSVNAVHVIIMIHSFIAGVWTVFLEKITFTRKSNTIFDSAVFFDTCFTRKIYHKYFQRYVHFFNTA